MCTLNKCIIKYYYKLSYNPLNKVTDDQVIPSAMNNKENLDLKKKNSNTFMYHE